MARKKKTDLRDYLETMPVSELVEYVLSLAERFDEVGQELRNQVTLATAGDSELVREVRRELRGLHEVEYEEDYHGWGGATVDLDHLRSLLGKLLSGRQYEALVRLGPDLLAAANHLAENQQECEYDDELKECVGVVFQAIEASSRSEADKLLAASDLCLRDEYDLCEETTPFFEKDWSAEAWSQLADHLAARLAAQPASERGTFGGHQRKVLVDWVTMALQAAGRDAEVLPLLEEEAPRTGNYLEVAQQLWSARRREDARAWVLRGLEKAQGFEGDSLRDFWRQMAEREKDWGTVAALRAEEFLASPDVARLHALEKAAKKAKCEAQVRSAALRFLETGKPPAFTTPAKDASAWPLPELPAPLRASPRRGPGREGGPYLDVLVRLAMEEKRPDDVLRWYDRYVETRKGPYWSGVWPTEVADAVADTHPDRALAIYQQEIEEHLKRTTVQAYQAARPHLQKVHRLLTRKGRKAEWAKYEARLREQHGRKPRFIEVLDEVARGT